MTKASTTKNKPAAKTVAKTIRKPTPKLVVSSTQKSEKKPKLVRDSFTIPKDEYQALGELKTRMTKLMQPAKKSELLRAGLKVLSALSDPAIKKALQSVPSIKTGRPAKSAAKSNKK